MSKASLACPQNNAILSFSNQNSVHTSSHYALETRGVHKALVVYNQQFPFKNLGENIKSKTRQSVIKLNCIHGQSGPRPTPGIGGLKIKMLDGHRSPVQTLHCSNVFHSEKQGSDRWQACNLYGRIISTAFYQLRHFKTSILGQFSLSKLQEVSNENIFFFNKACL